jgi:hypothetical protein
MAMHGKLHKGVVMVTPATPYNKEAVVKRFLNCVSVSFELLVTCAGPATALIASFPSLVVLIVSWNPAGTF